MDKKAVFRITVCPLFAAATAALSQIAVPIGPVPINLATFSVLCSGLVLGARLGALSQIIYLLLGLCGLPVFAFFRSGFAALTGPSGGFLLGYPLGAFAVGFFLKLFSNGKKGAYLACLAGSALYMATGFLWYAYSQQKSFLTAFLAVVAPFLPGAAIKIVLAVAVWNRVKTRLSV